MLDEQSLAYRCFAGALLAIQSGRAAAELSYSKIAASTLWIQPLSGPWNWCASSEPILSMEFMHAAITGLHHGVSST